MDSATLEASLRRNVGELTFYEAYRRTGLILCISVSPGSSFEKPRLLNYLTAPNVLVWSAALASCACPYLYGAAELVAHGASGENVPFAFRGVKWVDGSVAYDLPMPHMQRLFNADYFIVAQVNPHIIPFVQHAQRRVSTAWRRERPGVAHAALGKAWAWVKELAWLAWGEAAFLAKMMVRIAQATRLFSAADMLASIMAQHFVGDCTFVPPLSVTLYCKLLLNPDLDALHNFLTMAAACVRPCISTIKRHSDLQLAMDRCAERLAARAMDQALRRDADSALQAVSHCNSEGHAGVEDGKEGQELRRRWKLGYRVTNLNLSIDSL